MLELSLEPAGKDYLNIGVAAGANVIIRSPTFSEEKAAWECEFSIKGSESEFDDDTELSVVSDVFLVDFFSSSAQK